jgi:adenylate cyclase
MMITSLQDGIVTRGETVAQATSPHLSGSGLQLNSQEELSGRLRQAFQAEELDAVRRATWVSLAAIGGIMALAMALIRTKEAFFYIGLLAIFAVMIVAQYAVRRSRFSRPWHGFIFALAIFSWFAFAAFAPNPLDVTPWPPQMNQRFGWFVYSFIFLLPFVFRYSPLLMLWAGAAAATTWSVGLAWLYSLRDTVTREWSAAPDLAAALDPHFVNVDMWIQNVVVMLIVAAGLAAMAARARRLVFREADAERQRTNLSRYFSPSVVERLADVDEPLGRVRSQPVAVLFADIVGFTRMAEHMEPDATISFLRDFHGRLERAVFDHGGTLDKFLGDGVMATFGTPESGSRDAIAAINCAKAMLKSIAEWNLERGEAGEPSVRLSVGIHYGQATVGNIGSARRLEFAVLGDVVNVSSRIEALTRRLDCQLAVSESLVAAVRQQAGENAAALLKDLRNRGAQAIRGRDEAIGIWSLAPG